MDSKVFINREGDFTRADIHSVDEVEIFQGKENRITMVQTYSKKFHCTYLLQNFPFDTQVSGFLGVPLAKMMVLLLRFVLSTWCWRSLIREQQSYSP